MYVIVGKAGNGKLCFVCKSNGGVYSLSETFSTEDQSCVYSAREIKVCYDGYVRSEFGRIAALTDLSIEKVTPFIDYRFTNRASECITERPSESQDTPKNEYLKDSYTRRHKLIMENSIYGAFGMRIPKSLP